MNKFGFRGTGSGDNTQGTGGTSLQESLEQFLKSKKVEDTKAKIKETANNVVKKAEEYATKAVESVTTQSDPTPEPQPVPQPQPAPQPQPVPQPQPAQQQEPELSPEEMDKKGNQCIQQRDFVQGYTLISQAADRGNIESMNTMALGYMNGFGTEQNYYNGYLYLALAASRGNKYSMWNIGRMNLYGWGIPQDKANALRWIQRAYRAGHNYSTKSFITVLQKELDPTAADPTEEDMMAYALQLWHDDQYDMALEFAQNAVNRGCRKLQHFVGMSWDKGQGNPMDCARAIAYYEEASEAGVSESAYNLGRIYEFGKGTQKNYQLALQYY